MVQHPSPHGLGGKQHPGDPPVRYFYHFLGHRIGDYLAIVLQQQCFDLVGAKGQILHPKPTGLGAGDHQGQVWQAEQEARKDDHVAILVNILDKAVDEPADLRVFVDQVIVIQHDHEMFCDNIVDFVDNGCFAMLQGKMALAQGDQSSSRLLSKLRKALFDTRDEMSQEADEVVIRLAQGVPAKRKIMAMCDIDQQGRLAISGWSNDQG